MMNKRQLSETDWMISTDLRPVSTAALLGARAECLTLGHAQQENNEVRYGPALSYLRAMGVEPLSTSKRSVHANESALVETGLYAPATLTAARNERGTFHHQSLYLLQHYLHGS